jgi:hypothetical protein
MRSVGPLRLRPGEIGIGPGRGRDAGGRGNLLRNPQRPTAALARKRRAAHAVERMLGAAFGTEQHRGHLRVLLFQRALGLADAYE